MLDAVGAPTIGLTTVDLYVLRLFDCNQASGAVLQIL